MGLIRISVGQDIQAGPKSITGNWGRARALERANNPLPWRIGTLSDGALESLDNALMRACRLSGSYSKDALAGAFLLQASLSTGRSPDKLLKNRVFDADPKFLRSGSRIGLYRGGPNWAWWLTPGAPSSAQALKPEQVGIYRKTEKEILLWCGTRTRLLFEHAVEHNGIKLAHDELERASQMLPRTGAWSTETIRRLISAFLKNVPNAERLMLTPKRVEGWLFQNIVNQTGDVALAAIVTEDVGPLSNVTSHYTWASRKQAFELHYERTEPHERLVHPVGQASPKGREVCQIPRISRLQERVDCGYGSRFVPTVDFVQKLSHTLHNDILLSNGRYGDRTAFVEYHNNFTLFSIALIGFATGFRSVVNPVPSRRSIDFTTRLVSVNDKGKADQLRDRLAWLPECAFQQIMHYEKHMFKLYARLAKFGLTGTLDWETSSDRNDRQMVVLVDPVRGASPASVTDVAAAFSRKGFPIRMNAWRHYVRTELIELPSDVLHAFLGHWQRGQEPWSNASCLDPQAFRDALAGPLETLMKRDGWREVRGLGG